jgi:hypothetical protein
VDDRVDFDVLEEVKVNDVLVIPKGSVAWGTVTEAQAKRRMARGGKLDVNIDAVRLADGEKAALRGVKDVKGGGHTGGMTAGIVATSLIVWPAAPFFLFMHGKDITIPKGTEITAYINGDMNLDARKFAPGTLTEAPAVPVGPTATVGSVAVVVKSTPDRADIIVDGKFVGNTPSTVGLAVGDHTIVIEKPGFERWQRTMAVNGGGNITIDATLDRTQTATGSVGSVPQASPPATTIVPGHTGQPQAPGGVLTANVEAATVVVNSTPDGADITVDGKYVGTTPSTLRLSPGDHGVSVEKPGFKPWQRKVTLAAGSSPTISATLENDFVTSPPANSTKPKDELLATEGSPSATSDLSGSYAGEVTNTTIGVSGPFGIYIREENGGIYGCTSVEKPLVGSGGFQGTVNGSKVVFEATGKTLRIRFVGELQGDALKGSYTVFPTQQHGDFQVRRVDSKAPAIGFDPAQCRKD